jgi:catechol 2,3-dioxygenase-like lactoylglutathione lyase family enzyme
MSYVALATDSFDEMTRFYGDILLFPTIAAWDRPTGRGRRFDLGGGLRLEILDNVREKQPAALFAPGGRTHIVIEVADIDVAWRSLVLNAPAPQTMSWGARLFQIRDPDGIAITYLEWILESQATLQDVAHPHASLR